MRRVFGSAGSQSRRSNRRRRVTGSALHPRGKGIEIDHTQAIARGTNQPSDVGLGPEYLAVLAWARQDMEEMGALVEVGLECSLRWRTALPASM